jgi:hypothetical protein
MVVLTTVSGCDSITSKAVSCFTSAVFSCRKIKQKDLKALINMPKEQQGRKGDARHNAETQG